VLRLKACAITAGQCFGFVFSSFCKLLILSLTLSYDESSGVRHVRRMFHPGRGLGGPRARRSNMHFTSSSTGGLSSSQSSYSPSSREAMDPIAGKCVSTSEWQGQGCGAPLKMICEADVLLLHLVLCLDSFKHLEVLGHL
jgi:hypothetical protein